MNSIKKAVIAIAGKGKRMYPITKAIPKEMLPIGTTPILQIIINEVIESGINQICFIISDNRQMVTNFLCGEPNPEDYNISQKTYKYNFNESVSLSFVYQLEPQGTAKAVELTKKFVGNDSFALLYGDDIFVGFEPALKPLVELSQKFNGATVLGVQHIDPLQAANYATITCEDFDGDFGVVVDIVEKQKAEDITSDLTSVGRYILAPSIFDSIKLIEPHQGEYWISDAIHYECLNSNVFARVLTAVRHDTGNPKGYIHAFKTLC